MNAREHARWWLAYGRLQLDRFLTQRHGLARIAIAALFLAVAARPAWRLQSWVNRFGQAHDGATPQHAVIQIVVYIVILIVAAILAYALAPKPKDPEPGKSRIPEAEDGKSVIRIYGTVWIEDPMVCGFKRMGEIPIKKKAGK